MIFPKETHEIILFESSQFKAKLVTEGRLVSPFSEIKEKYDKPIISQFFGLIVFLVSFFGLGLTIGPMVAKEASFRISQFQKEVKRVAKKQPPKEQKIKFSDLLGKVEFESIPAPVDADFGIVIPKIGVNAKVIANVSPEIPQEFSRALKKGVAHAAGTSLPNQDGLVFIFGHSTDYAWNVSRYNAIFYQIKDLEIGDEINLFYQGRRYFYKVTEKRIVAAKDTSFLKGKSDNKELILQTCWPPGTTKERLLVFAKPITIETEPNLDKHGSLVSYNLTN